jgi:hypothetical protein
LPANESYYGGQIGRLRNERTLKRVELKFSFKKSELKFVKEESEENDE